MKNVSTTALTVALSTITTGAWADDWDLLRGITVDEVITDTSYQVNKTFPAAIQNGREGMVLTGYAVPLTPGSDIRELVLVSDMGFCPFCGDPSHGASVQVSLETAIPGLEEGARITLRGDMTPIHDPQTWNAAILENAVIVES
ncbi:hypothetical protein CLV80_101127 [Yoonia maritima]|uniref:DUF3299 domain-containing protein n=1 Tax=Yoonia maritima TaxID=1435347 RepID=A0A2T0W468_9RHOB|nr:hypothetical protein [Yoonia maritima]PRY80276.1 hypothetical protein CLV80_101127 [Yoonia maritima]